MKKLLGLHGKVDFAERIRFAKTEVRWLSCNIQEGITQTLKAGKFLQQSEKKQKYGRRCKRLKGWRDVVHHCRCFSTGDTCQKTEMVRNRKQGENSHWHATGALATVLHRHGISVANHAHESQNRFSPNAWQRKQHCCSFDFWLCEIGSRDSRTVQWGFDNKQMLFEAAEFVIFYYAINWKRLYDCTHYVGYHHRLSTTSWVWVA